MTMMDTVEQALKTEEQQIEDMADEDLVEIRAEVPKEDFEEMKEFIDEYKTSRKYSNAFYTRKIFEIALSNKKKFEDEFGHVLDTIKD